MAWFAYEMNPIDHWDGWESYVPPGAPPVSEERPPFEDGQYLERYLAKMYQEALRQFPRLGWEGDGHWQYAGIPPANGNPGPELILAVKQQNNGTVYVLSPVVLPHLANP
jgi:hypothetical protein